MQSRTTCPWKVHSLGTIPDSSSTIEFDPSKPFRSLMLGSKMKWVWCISPPILPYSGLWSLIWMCLIGLLGCDGADASKVVVSAGGVSSGHRALSMNSNQLICGSHEYQYFDHIEYQKRTRTKRKEVSVMQIEYKNIDAKLVVNEIRNGRSLESVQKLFGINLNP